MDFVQLKPFNQGKGGTTPNMCLANVTAGYGIPNKYGSAWEAWENTQQHPDNNVPTGLDVPLYYSYTATIDGVTQNYGHINVRLANGTVWSDGNIYANIAAYEANHTPKFVGWGESVNGIAVIKQVTEEPMIDENHLNALTMAYFNRGPNAQENAQWLNKATYPQVIEAFDASAEYKQAQATRYANAEAVAGKFTKLNSGFYQV